MHSHGSAQKTIDLSRALKQASLRVTRPRQAILKYLLKHHGPLTVDQIYRGVRSEKCDRVTVYRGASALEKAGLLSRCDFGDGVARFELAHEHSDSHHHHVICSRCQSVEPAKLCLDEAWKKHLGDRGYAKISHRLEFFGICPRCQQSVKSS